MRAKTRQTSAPVSMRDVAERIDPLDGQLPHRAVPQSAVGAVEVGSDLMGVPIQRRIARLPGPPGRTGVLGEVEIDVDGVRLADRAAGDLLARVQHRRHEVSVPQQEFNSTPLHRLDQPIRIRPARRQRLVLHDMLAGQGRAHAQVTVPFGLGTDDGYLDVKLAQGARRRERRECGRRRRTADCVRGPSREGQGRRPPRPARTWHVPSVPGPRNRV